MIMITIMIMIVIVIVIVIMAMIGVIMVMTSATKFMVMENEEFGRIERFDRNWGCAKRKSKVRGFDSCGFVVEFGRRD